MVSLCYACAYSHEIYRPLCVLFNISTRGRFVWARCGYYGDYNNPIVYVLFFYLFIFLRGLYFRMGWCALSFMCIRIANATSAVQLESWLSTESKCGSRLFANREWHERGRWCDLVVCIWPIEIIIGWWHTDIIFGLWPRRRWIRKQFSPS